MFPILHPDSDRIVARLQQEGITALYHFTSVDNLRGLSQVQALCSKQTLENLHLWPPPSPGGNDLSHVLDKRNNNWHKVGLNLTPYTPMCYRKKREQHLCFLIFPIELAGWANVIFTDTNATKANHRRGEGLTGLNYINFTAFRIHEPWNRDGWHTPVQAEALIPDRIPVEYISEIAFVSQPSLEYGNNLWGTNPRPIFAVRERMFYDSFRDREVNFPHVLKLTLTDKDIDQTNVGESYDHQYQFSKKISKTITLIVEVKSLASTQVRVVWYPIGRSETMTLDSRAIWHHWPSLAVDDLPIGHCHVDYYVDRLKWASLPFEILP